MQDDNIHHIGERTPLRLADGKLVYPGGRVVDPASTPQMIEVPTNREAQQLVVRTRRKLSDLPDVPRTMNAVSVVLSYTLFGLDDIEIALVTKMTEEQVTRVKATEGYAMMHESVIKSILEGETDNVRDIFSQHSRTAAGVLVEALHNGSRGDKMVAAKDFLDRAGHRPADIVEHRHRLDGGLIIEVINKDEKNVPPIIEMEIHNDSES